MNPQHGSSPPVDTTAHSMEFTSLTTGIFVLLIVVWSYFGPRVSSRSQHLGEGSTACILGLATGLVLLLFTLPSKGNKVDRALEQGLLSFSSAAFFTYLLPPVIFYAGISVEKKRFFRNLPSILSYGVAGTFVCFLILVAFLMALTPLSLQDTLAVGAIFAATDSVATLQILEHHPNPLLFSLVFGEGVMNDATSVVLLRAVTQGCRGQCPGASWGLAWGICAHFLYLFVTSFLLGSFTGLGISWLLKHGQLKGPHQEVALIGLLAYLGYLLAEVLGLSGILALFCCGLVVSHYALHSCSADGATTTLTAFRALSAMSEGLIFIYVGMDTLDPVKWAEASKAEALWLFIVLVLGLFLSRAAFVVPVSLAHNRWSREHLTLRDMVVIWWAGLIRGAVSVALVYYQFDQQGGPGQRSTLIVTTLAVVLVSILVFGALTKPLLALLLRESDESLILRLSAIRSQASSQLRRHQPGWFTHLGAGYRKVHSASELHSLRGEGGTPGVTPPRTPAYTQLGVLGAAGAGGGGGTSGLSKEAPAGRRHDDGNGDQDLEFGDFTDPPPAATSADAPPATPRTPTMPHRATPATPLPPPSAPSSPSRHARGTPANGGDPSEADPLVPGRQGEGQDLGPPTVISQFWSTFDEQFMRPLFGGAPSPPPYAGNERVRDGVIARRGLD